jgi:hypothetical protein
MDLSTTTTETIKTAIGRADPLPDGIDEARWQATLMAARRVIGYHVGRSDIAGGEFSENALADFNGSSPVRTVA